MKKIKEYNIKIKQLADQIKSGKTVVYPTETCYGVGCDGRDNQAVEKIFNIKQRDKDKPLLVLMPSLDVAQEYIRWDSETQRLAEKYWPGPLTIVAELKKGVELPQGLTKDGTLACRVSSHGFASQLAAELNGPLVSTSANISGKDSPYTVREVESMFEGRKHQPDVIVDAGKLEQTPPSTIVRTIDGVEVLREGAIELDQL
ncbi:MAG: L-threonylcarbamoyladenylate synthase [Candidatus Paceibacteria bacterium]